MSLIAASASIQPVGASTPNQAPMSITPVPVVPVAPNNITAAANHAQRELVSPTSACPISSPLPLRSLILANGTRVEFTAADVPPPPSISFASDIPLLNSMWDDTSPYWGNYSVLNIRGVYIPIIYWKKVYSRCPNGGGSAWKPKQWQSIKNDYSKWQVSLILHPCYLKNKLLIPYSNFEATGRAIPQRNRRQFLERVQGQRR